MECKKTVFNNGLTLLVTEIPELKSATVTVWVKVGSRHEEAAVSGISHFLEHMVFKGGERYQSAEDISRALDSLGADFNAETSKEWTSFYIRSRVETISNAFDILSDMLITPKLSEDDINRERGVILEEMKMYEDTPMYRISDLFEQVLFSGTPLGLDIIGSKKTINDMKRADFIAFKEHHYDPSKILITVAGGITEEGIKALTERYFISSLHKRLTVEVDTITSDKRERLLVSNKKSEQANLVFGFKSIPYSDPRRHTLDVLATVLGDGMSSRLFTEVREKRGLAYTVRTGVDYFADTGSIGTFAGVNPDQAVDALKVIIDEHKKIAHRIEPITEAELAKAKEYLKGHLALSLESTKAINTFFGYEEIMIGKTTTPEEEFKNIDLVTIDDIHTLAADLFSTPNAHLAIIGPFLETAQFESLLNE